MKCSFCKKIIKEDNLYAVNGKNYHDDFCYISSIKKDYNKKINYLLNYYFSYNDNSIKVPHQYFINFNKLKKKINDEKYILYFLYTSRDILLDINFRFKYSNNTRMYKLWVYLKDNIFIFLPLYLKKQEDMSYYFKSEDKEVKIKKRKKNKLLEY